MTKGKKEFSDEEKRAVSAAGLVWRLWEPVYRAPSSIIVRNCKGEVRMVDLKPNRQIHS